jgi:predicted glycosyltransferase
VKILIDIGHPAHVHYFRNFISIMKGKGHVFLISARNRSMIHYLLDKYNLQFFSRGKGRNGITGKLFYMLYADWLLLKKANRFKPDLFLSFASPYAAQTAWLIHRPHIVLDDTEHAKYGHMFYKPFSTILLNPICFYKKFGKKQVFFNSYMEYCYLHPTYFKPNQEIYSYLGIPDRGKYVILRFVSWHANHDIGHSGLNNVTKLELINLLSNRYRVFVSSEGNQNDVIINKYLIKIPPELMHDALHYADFFITESGTMASEAAILNTPVIYVNSLPLMGYLRDEEKSGLLFHFKNSSGVTDKVVELMNIPDIKEAFYSKNLRLLENKINPTLFFVWFIENFPESVKIMMENPEYQNRFR